MACTYIFACSTDFSFLRGIIVLCFQLMPRCKTLTSSDTCWMSDVACCTLLWSCRLDEQGTRRISDVITKNNNNDFIRQSFVCGNTPTGNIVLYVGTLNAQTKVFSVYVLFLFIFFYFLSTCNNKSRALHKNVLRINYEFKTTL